MSKLSLYFLHFAHEVAFPKQLAFGVFFLKLFGNRRYCRSLNASLQCCAEGTIGHQLLAFMKKNGFDFVPWYEKHDLKHVILGYGTTAPEEMHMQAFMFGNAGFRPIITLITLTFLIWTPDAWKYLPYHFLVGKLTRPVGGLRVEAAANLNLEEFRRQIGLEEAKERAAAVIAMFHGEAQKIAV